MNGHNNIFYHFSERVPLFEIINLLSAMLRDFCYSFIIPQINVDGLLFPVQKSRIVGYKLQPPKIITFISPKKL